MKTKFYKKRIVSLTKENDDYMTKNFLKLSAFVNDCILKLREANEGVKCRKKTNKKR